MSSLLEKFKKLLIGEKNKMQEGIIPQGLWSRMESEIAEKLCLSFSLLDLKDIGL